MSKTIAAGLFIVRKDKKVLICHPTNHKATEYSIPKGKVEENEIFLEAAFRETFEETNLDLGESLEFNVYPLASVNYRHRKKILYPFLVLEKKTSKFDWGSVELKCNSNVPEERGGFPEMDGYRWVTLEEAKTLLHETQVACLDRITELIQQ
jgi:8-oxo-dGTP pyrophosphatase MutT (NUDIX family)